ncbi:MAG TPA: hypothetical protein VK116_09520, partial [Planctomycetota bacterium]|nr:hypothetical protein [Planctomycetota bacterium]
MVPERIEYTIVQDWKENPRKCTVEPLRATRAIHLYRLREPGARDVPLAVGGGIVLAIDAPVLAPDDRAWLDETRTVIVLDATWKRVGKVRRRVQFTEPERTIERRLPSEIVTAYPRR